MFRDEAAKKDGENGTEPESKEAFLSLLTPGSGIWSSTSWTISGIVCEVTKGDAV